MSDIKAIKNELEFYQTQLIAEIKRFPWNDKMAYAQWLANTYHYAFNSTRVIALGAGAMPTHLTKISNRFIQHAAEEKGHEKLLENDVKALGLDIVDIPVSSIMQIYYRSLYYWVSPAGNPVGLFGWILSLEALAANAGGSVLSEVKKFHNPKCCSFLNVHSDADPEHLNKALEAISFLSPDELKIVSDSLKMYSENYVRLLSEISNGVISVGRRSA